MKFSDYFFSPGVRGSATFAGLFSGVALGMFTRWEYGIIAGAGVAILVTLILPLVMYLQDLPMRRVRARLTGPFHFDEQVLFRSPRGAFGGYFLLTDASLILLTREKNGKACMELSRDDVRSVSIDDRTTLRIFLNETQYICVLCGAAEEIFEFLSRNGWNTAKN